MKKCIICDSEILSGYFKTQEGAVCAKCRCKVTISGKIDIWSLTMTNLRDLPVNLLDIKL